MQILMPQLNDAGDPGEVQEIFVRIGDVVALGQKLLAVEMEKAVIEIEATAAGRVTGILVQPGEQIAPGRVLFDVE